MKEKKKYLSLFLPLSPSPSSIANQHRPPADGPHVDTGGVVTRAELPALCTRELQSRVRNSLLAFADFLSLASKFKLGFLDIN